MYEIVLAQTHSKGMSLFINDSDAVLCGHTPKLPCQNYEVPFCNHLKKDASLHFMVKACLEGCYEAIQYFYVIIRYSTRCTFIHN